MREKAHDLSRRNFLIGLLSSLSLRRKRTTARASARPLEEKKMTIREAGAQTSEKDVIAQFYGQYYAALERRLEDIFPGDAKAIVDDFFSAQSLPQLTPVFCDWDNVWGDELKDGRYGVIFARPETIGYGGLICRFQFTRVSQI